MMMLYNLYLRYLIWKAKRGVAKCEAVARRCDELSAKCAPQKDGEKLVEWLSKVKSLMVATSGKYRRNAETLGMLLVARRTLAIGKRIL